MTMMAVGSDDDDGRGKRWSSGRGKRWSSDDGRGKRWSSDDGRGKRWSSDDGRGKRWSSDDGRGKRWSSDDGRGKRWSSDDGRGKRWSSDDGRGKRWSSDDGHNMKEILLLSSQQQELKNKNRAIFDIPRDGPRRPVKIAVRDWAAIFKTASRAEQAHRIPPEDEPAAVRDGTGRENPIDIPTCIIALASQRLHAAGMCLEKSNSMTLNSMLSLRKCTMKRNNHNVNHYKKTADEKVVAFQDIKPAAQRHYLIIPVEHIPTVGDLQRGDEDYSLVSCMLSVGKELLHKDAPQTLHRFGFHQPPFNSVDHLHLHCFALPFLPSRDTAGEDKASSFKGVTEPDSPNFIAWCFS
uniref:HIT domain-containing protein n=1 Tax=Brassica campestris TaxID=3711 RepID=M4D893_BRACM